MLTDHDKKLLTNIQLAHCDFVASVDGTIHNANSVEALIEEGLKGSVPMQMTALELFRRSPVEARIRLLPALLQCSRAISAFVIPAIHSLPIEWLTQNIEAATFPLLDHADHIDFDFFLQVMEGINSSFANRLAQRALTNSDPDVRELGHEHLSLRHSA